MGQHPGTRNHCIDGLRGIAVLSVILYHLHPSLLPGGFVGVDVFFVISGYVVCGSLLRDRHRSCWRTLSAFYSRRFIRIYPALLVTLLVTAVLTRLFIPECWLAGETSQTGFYAFWGLSNWSLVAHTDGYFSPRSEFNPYTHTWSLGVEEQYYLLFPLLFLLHRRLAPSDPKGLGRGLALIFVLLVGSLGFSAVATRSYPTSAYFMLPSRFWELASGACLCLLQATGRCFLSSAAVTSWVSIGGVLLMSMAMVKADPSAFPFPWALAPVGGTLCLLMASASPSCSSSLLLRGLSRAPVVYMGVISYSLYLWHWPAFVLFRWTVGLETAWSMAAALGVTLLAGAGSFRWIEVPTQSWFRERPYRPILVMMGSLVAIGIASRFQSRVATAFQLALSRTVEIGREPVWHPHWNGLVKVGDFFVHPEAGEAWRGRRIFLVGDSHAGAYLQMVSRLAKEQGPSIYYESMGAFRLGSMVYPLEERQREFAKRIRGDIRRLARPGDIVFLAALRVERFCDQWASFDVEQVVKKRDSAQAEHERLLAVEEARDFLEELEQLEVHVVVDAPKPVLLSPPFRCSDWFNAMNPIGSRGLDVDREFLLRHREPAMRSIHDLQKRFPSLCAWDPFPVLAGEGAKVRAFLDGKPLFFDGDHLSAYVRSPLPQFPCVHRRSVEEMIDAVFRPSCHPAS